MLYLQSSYTHKYSFFFVFFSALIVTILTYDDSVRFVLGGDKKVFRDSALLQTLVSHIQNEFEGLKALISPKEAL
jgi:hypothetical protein